MAPKRFYKQNRSLFLVNSQFKKLGFRAPLSEFDLIDLTTACFEYSPDKSAKGKQAVVRFKKISLIDNLSVFTLVLAHLFVKQLE